MASFLVPVSLFKAAVKLELTRRENEEKVLALNVRMCDMMEVLTMHVLPPHSYQIHS